MSFWNNVDELIGKKKGDKPVKVTANQLNEYRTETNEKIKKLEKDLKIEQTKYEAEAKRYDNLNEETNNLKKELESLKKKNSELEKSIKEKDETIKSATEQIKQMEQGLAEIQNQNQQLQSQIQAFQTQIIQYQTTLSNMVSADVLQEKDDQILLIQTQNESLIKQNKAMMAKFKELKSKMGDSDKIKSQAEEIAKLKDKQIADLQQENLKYQAKIREIETEKISQIEERDKKIQDLNMKILQLQSSKPASAGAGASTTTGSAKSTSFADEIKKDLGTLGGLKPSGLSGTFPSSSSKTAAKKTISTESNVKPSDLLKKAKTTPSTQSNVKPSSLLGSKSVDFDKNIKSKSFGMKAPSAEKPAPSHAGKPNIPIKEQRTGGESSRNRCPNCGSTAIREVTDKTKIISYIPTPIYGKKKVCIKCMYEWS